MDVLGNLRGCRARSPMFVKPSVFRDLSVSPTYTASHSSHLILYTGPTTFFLLTGSFGFTNNCRSVFVGLKYVGMPYFPKTRLICSENPFTYGITTGIFFDFSFIDVSNVSPDVSTSLSESLFFLLLSPSKSILGSHCISMLLLDGQVLSSYPPFRSPLSLLCVPMFSLLRHHHLAQHPRQHHWDVLTDEADSRRRKLLWVDFFNYPEY